MNDCVATSIASEIIENIEDMLLQLCQFSIYMSVTVA